MWSLHGHFATIAPNLYSLKNNGFNEMLCCAWMCLSTRACAAPLRVILCCTCYLLGVPPACSIELPTLLSHPSSLPRFFFRQYSTQSPPPEHSASSQFNTGPLCLKQRNASVLLIKSLFWRQLSKQSQFFKFMLAGKEEKMADFLSCCADFLSRSANLPIRLGDYREGEGSPNDC